MKGYEKYTLTQNPVLVSFNYTGTVAEGDAVVLVSNDTVGRGSSNGNPIGVVHAVVGDKVTVQTRGAMVAKYTGTAPTVGAGKLLQVDGTGKVQASTTSGTVVDILYVDTTDGVVVFAR